MEILNYTKQYEEKILEIDYEALDIFDDRSLREKYRLKNIESYFLGKNGEFYVLKVEGEIIGMCGFIELNNKIVELVKFRIAKSKRDMGFGKKLLEFVEQQIKRKGYEKIILNTSILRENTLRFYEKRGYVFKEERIIDEIKVIDYEKILL
ncbi:MAG: hypothetical protein A2Y30_01380 [Spirochaetes bacterium GWE1_32_154]|nr:MAG: hypothetical protein A2Y30_01380 [Spirochaetes bacterium GWE1_32_154]